MALLDQQDSFSKEEEEESEHCESEKDEKKNP